MIDIHTHLLPGVDDGSRSFEDSVGILESFAAAGVQRVCCTPHLSASRIESAPFEPHLALLAELQSRAPQGIQLLSGWEIMLDAPGAKFADPRLCLGSSNAVLVEFPRLGLPPNATAELMRIRSDGKVPVVAHPERYRGCTVAMVDEWRQAGAVIQMDVTAILRPSVGDLPRDILARGLCDLFASDTHVDRRSLASVRQWLVQFGSREHAELLTRVNAEHVLSNREVQPVPPLVLSSGVVGWLRNLLRRDRPVRR
jgi:protein-tyrosine phosphatase